MNKNLFTFCLINKYLQRPVFATAIFILAVFLFALPSLLLKTDHASANSPSPNQPVLLVLGDSLSASFGIEQSQGWVAMLDKKLANTSYAMHIINASISGETTQGGLQRLPALLEKHNPALVIIELGGNDGLRGLQLSMIKSNLLKIIDQIKATDADILLTGIRLPPNYGQQYTKQFYQIYTDLAAEKQLSLVPFLLDGVATNGSLMQADGIHPTAEAQAAILETVWKTLIPMLRKASVRETSVKKNQRQEN